MNDANAHVFLSPHTMSTRSNVSKPSSSLKRIPQEYIGQIDNAEGWYAAIDEACRIFSIPDLSTRSGLKKVHADFDAIYRRLDSAYEAHRNDDKVAGSIVGIYAQMCADVVLRNKLFAKGFLKRLIPLLRRDLTRHLILRSLSAITHHGGADVKIEVSREANFLAQTILEFPDDVVGAELVVTILSHSLPPVIFFEDVPPAPAVFMSLNMHLIIKAVVTTCRNPKASTHVIDHGTKLISLASLHCAGACRSHPSSIALLVAGLRSKDWSYRATCIGGLVSLHRIGAQEDTNFLDPSKLLTAVSGGFPIRIREIMVNYGIERCDTVSTLQTSAKFRTAMMQCAQDKNLYALGLKLVDLILGTEFSISKGAFDTVNPRTGAIEEIDVGLPFSMWDESLPHCAKAIRAKGNRAGLDKADILDIKYLITARRLPAAFKMAEKSFARNPNCAYYQYALSLTGEPEPGLRASKKGLKCSDTTPYLRFQLMQHAVENAGELGIRILQSVREHGDQTWKEGTAFLMSALEDSRTFIQQAPPDNRHMKDILCWNILLRLAIEGHELSLGLEELKRTREQLALADEISTIIGVPPPKTYLRQTQETALRLYAAATTEWGDVIARRDAPSRERHEDAHQHDHPRSVDSEINAWMEGLSLDGGSGEDPCKSHTHRMHPKISSNYVELYQCSWCRNPSAVLRKCSGCTVTRYCDGQCQKSHWKEHKRVCKEK